MRQRRRFRVRAVFLVLVWVLLLVLSMYLLSVLVSVFSGSPKNLNISSLSWAGYIVANFSAVSEVTGINGSWIVPQVNASSGSRYSSVWLGIGGQVDRTLIQIGTEQDMVNGEASYSAWYELLPNYAIQIEEVTLSPGDRITASIDLIDSRTNLWRIQLTDVTTGANYSKTLVYNSTRSSGEWIVERPTINSQISTLSNFGQVNFSECYVTIGNATDKIEAFPYSKVQMTDNQNSLLISVSTVNTDGAGFTVTYEG